MLERNGDLNNYRGSLHIGKSVLNRVMRCSCMASRFEEVETDAAGRSIRVLSRTPPIPGNNLILSLDLDYRKLWKKAFGDHRGALVHDPNNCECSLCQQARL